ncbi:hypothetical protein D9C73_018943 [Collichthys lucidus]|uniref:Coiled-coil domain-containing protein 106 n=1 Tax=Collichthys lucidus TaxID=240159 RepID=A0A4U5V954_COLLU|nr:hypothetical protein D9C73_018943 [Collichthys lucidus]
MSNSVQTTSDGLCKLVRWAHSHGTICDLIPRLQHFTCGSYNNMLTPEPGPNGSSVPVAVWGCSGGHAYHWPLSDHGNSNRGSASTSQGQEKLVRGHPSNKVTVRASSYLSCSEGASEGDEFSSRLFDMAECDSSATDDDGDYEPCPSSRKRGGLSGGKFARKKVKQEEEDFDTAANIDSTVLAVTDAISVPQAPNTQSQIVHTLPPFPQPQNGQDPGCGVGLVDPQMELLGEDGCMTGTKEQAEGCSSATEMAAGGQNELEKLQALLCAERSRNQQMTQIISSLKQDKQLLQNELTKKAELICDFLQDRLRPGSDSLTLFDSFEETEFHSLKGYRTPKSKRCRDGENTRVRMKNVVGVIARYMTALQEFRHGVSMKVAFDRVGVDRNTISRTASIAELSLAAPEVFHALAPWDEKEETLAHYAHRCRQAMDDNIKAKIKTMKAKGELLPIVSK